MTADREQRFDPVEQMTVAALHARIGELEAAAGRERRLALAVLTESEDRYRSLIMAMDEGVVLQDSDAAVIAFNDSATRILGLTPEQMTGRTSYDPRWRAVREDGSPFAGADHPVPVALRSGLPQSNVVMGVYKPDGALTWISVSVRPLFRDGESKAYRVVATMVDTTLQRRIEAELIRSAHTDSLTGLLNRAGFMKAVRKAMSEGGDQNGANTVLLLDLDRFTDVNDTLGPQAGDCLLAAVAERLTDARPEAIIGRFGGDEFAVLLRDMNGHFDVDAIANRMLEAVIAPVHLEGIDVRLGVSVGVAIDDRRDLEVETLLSRANLALNRAKAQGRGLIGYFTEAMEVAARGRELHAAIDGGQLRLVYQPQFDAGTGAIIGAEALLRWDHPVRGAVGPAEFIPISESLGLATSIGRWVIENACRQIRAWLDDGLSPPPVAINLSATHFTTAGELERDLDAAMTRHAVTPDRLELELTETVLMGSATDHNETLLRLRSRGFSLSIDDFGTGYSSLDYLRRFSADRIKIDQSFIKDIDSTPGAEAIIKAVIGLAREMDMGVIAEGVETKAQCDRLRAWDCGQMQGYYFARPVAADAFTVFLDTGLPLPN
jgi:diguanylate cyclase (GGDEF)-like protein/PAS domain S-box-containing protein